jgi:hypothetical protein
MINNITQEKEKVSCCMRYLIKLVKSSINVNYEYRGKNYIDGEFTISIPLK